ncbi:hypothetical protein [Pseudooceanicola algae]|uniref:N-acetyltransferase domain-containing protein n=1 Tax=Pseudooceanicola algae TaxID=1537215 RepID=A0A418SK67_9RHOB|nr:hypothetical protein [Pseudooceanicola algae]QPM89147.1 hypothetical protein PSAL_003580 [Pseudooceanicola algae]
MIHALPFDNQGAMAVFRWLDANDRREAEIVRGAPQDHIDLFCDWRAVQSVAALSFVLRTERRTPFAVLAVVPTGQAGVAQAAMLARSHEGYRHSMARTAVMIRRGLPAWAQSVGFNRLEARCWAGHPTAARFLRGCGFHQETAVPGYGADGTETFLQFAWTQDRRDPHVQGT